MVIDSSALTAILLAEPQAEQFASAIALDEVCIGSAARVAHHIAFVFIVACGHCDLPRSQRMGRKQSFVQPLQQWQSASPLPHLPRSVSSDGGKLETVQLGGFGFDGAASLIPEFSCSRKVKFPDIKRMTAEAGK